MIRSKCLLVLLVIIDLIATAVICFSFATRTRYLPKSMHQCQDAMTWGVSDGRKDHKTLFEALAVLVEPPDPSIAISKIAQAFCRETVFVLIMESCVL